MTTGKTWENELDSLDLVEVVIEEEEVIKEVEVPVNVDERYVVLPGRTGPRLYCTTCRLYVREVDDSFVLRDLINIGHEHERLNHYGK